MLPQALDNALPQVGGRYHAIVVDEGQDFERRWLDLLYVMLTDPAHDVLYVFHDPEQSLYQQDVVAELSMPEYNVDWNSRNPGPIHALAARYSKALGEAQVMRAEGRAPEILHAAPGREALEALRKVLHRLTAEQGLAPVENRGADRRFASQVGGLAPTAVRQPGAVERRLRRRRPALGCVGGRHPRAADRHHPVRLHPPLLEHRRVELYR